MRFSVAMTRSTSWKQSPVEFGQLPGHWASWVTIAIWAPWQLEAVQSNAWWAMTRIPIERQQTSWTPGTWWRWSLAILEYIFSSCRTLFSYQMMLHANLSTSRKQVPHSWPKFTCTIERQMINAPTNSPIDRQKVKAIPAWPPKSSRPQHLPCILEKTTTPRSLCCFKTLTALGEDLMKSCKIFFLKTSNHLILLKKHIVELSTLTTSYNPT